jgi:hypothetical protein
LQGTEGYWASILQLTPSAIARKSSNGAGSSVVQGRLVKDRDDVDVINILHEAEAMLEAASCSSRNAPDMQVVTFLKPARKT